MNTIWKYTLLIVFIVLVDQLSKGAAQALFSMADKTTLSESLMLTYKKNVGQAPNSFLIGFSFLIIIWSFYRMVIKGRKKFFYGLPYALVFAGFVGNLLDRLLFGYVVNIIRFGGIRGFNTFNLADICIVSAVFLLVFNIFSPVLKKKRV